MTRLTPWQAAQHENHDCGYYECGPVRTSMVAPLTIKQVIVDSPTTVTITADLTHMCPFRYETDNGTVAIVWETAGKTLELHSLRMWLDSWRERRVSHEDITAAIQSHLDGLSGITNVHVHTTWETAGMEVQVAVLREPLRAESGSGHD